MNQRFRSAVFAMSCGMGVAASACGGGGTASPDGPAPDGTVAPDAAPPDTGSIGPRVLELNGAIAPVHDPSIIFSGTRYFLFATGQGLPIHTSVDLTNWSLAGKVFASKPAWITTTNPQNPNDLWAPDISYFGGQYHLYYSASRFGVNSSCIGHATSASLEPAEWIDQGALLCSTSTDDFNAIDPNAIVDGDGNAWLAFGSFWSGLKLIPLDAQGARLGTDMSSLSTRMNTAVEAPFIVRRDDAYFLFESVDFCCQGTASTYKVMVGRSEDIRGPYVDKDGVPLLSGGGTLVVTADSRWRGPGHNAILKTEGGRHYNVYHSYDAQAGGIPTLRIAEVEWSELDGWPISAGP